MRVYIYLAVAFVGMCFASGTLIHKKVEAVVGATSAIVHKVQDVKEKKIEFVKDISHKTWDTVKAVNNKGLAWASSFWPKKKVVLPQHEQSVTYKVRKYHGLEVTPIIHSVQQTHVHVQQPSEEHVHHQAISTSQLHVPVQQHGVYKPVEYQEIHAPVVHHQVQIPVHVPPKHTSLYHHASVEHKIPTQDVHHTVHNYHSPISGVYSSSPNAYAEWKQQEWVPSFGPEHTELPTKVQHSISFWPKEKFITKLQKIHGGKHGWKPPLNGFKFHADAQTDIHKDWSGVNAYINAPSYKASAENLWQEGAAPSISTQWSAPSEFPLETVHPTNPVQYSIKHPGQAATSYKEVQQDFSSQPAVVYSEQDHNESPYHKKPLRNSYGEIISEDTGSSPSENLPVAVPAPTSQQGEDSESRTLLLPSQPEEQEDELDVTITPVINSELPNDSSNSTTSA